MAGDGKEESCINLSEEIVDKLYILNYDKDFLGQKSLKPLITDYFAIEINSHEQFNYFKSLVKWLFSLNGVEASDFDTYEDPNTVAQNMQYEMRKLNVNIDVVASKLKHGHGAHVCEVLLALVNTTLKKKNVTLMAPQFPKNEDNSRMERDIGGEDDDNIDFEDNAIYEDDDDGAAIADEAQNDNKKVIESKADEKEWRNECDLVKKKLESVSGVDQKEWRQHIERSKELSDNIQKPNVKANLEKLSDLLEKQLDKIMSRENDINKAMTDIGEVYRDKNEKYKELQTEIDHLSVKVKKLNEEYSQLSVKNEQLQGKLSKQTDDATNYGPLIKIKDTIQQLKNEIKSMDIRIGVLNNIIWKFNYETKREQMDDNLGNKDKDLYKIMESPDMEELEDE